eukprot:Nk52_evm11s159 gene=Nk52_evmTU11s159
MQPQSDPESVKCIELQAIYGSGEEGELPFPVVSHTKLALVDNRPYATVFGASKSDPALYEESENLGAVLGRLGYNIINGAYFGTMEGMSKGIHDQSKQGQSSGCAVGITVPPLFTHRKDGNEYLKYKVPTEDIDHRLMYLCNNSSVYIALPGSIGTLNEIIYMYNKLHLNTLKEQVQKESATSSPPPATTDQQPQHEQPLLVLYRKPWEGIMTMLAKELDIDPHRRTPIVYVDDWRDVEKLLSSSSHRSK